MRDLNIEEIAEKYNSIENIWNENDSWHSWTHKNIEKFINTAIREIPFSSKYKILNAGSGGYSYNLNESQITHMDIAQQKLVNFSNAIVGNIENIPISKEQFDLIICVGSVLNYCEPMRVISEFSRVLNKNEYIILEFENSYTFELLGKNGFKKSATFTETFYNGNREKLWLYSEKFILNIAEMHGLKPILNKRFHIISPLVYRIFKKEKLASYFSVFDKFFSFIPFIKKYSSNVIFLLKKEC